MATIASSSTSPVAHRHPHESGFLAEIRAFWRLFFARAFDPYRPELHYMRGPGPAWRARHAGVSPAVQSMVAEIRAAKAPRPSVPRQ